LTQYGIALQPVTKQHFIITSEADYKIRQSYF